MARLDNKTALITGAGEGIGLAIAKRLASEGANIVIAEFNPVTGASAAQALARDYGVATLLVPTDVTRKEQMEAAVAAANERFGGVDILVNNAFRAGTYVRAEHKTDADLQFCRPSGPCRPFFPT